MKNLTFGQASSLLGILGTLFASTTWAAPSPAYQAIYNSVSRTQLIEDLKNMTGTQAVSVGGQQFSITNRYSAQSKALFRKFWTSYFEKLHIPVQEFAYATEHTGAGETQGHNLEAVLPGASPDSIVIIVHYDSIGPSGAEDQNPGVDDDMSGMSVSLETARLLAPYAGKLQHTVRFVAADYEEWSGPGLEGARTYAKYIQQLSQEKNFKIIAAIDNEQMGWSGGDQGKSFDVYSCSGGMWGSGQYNYPALGDELAAVATDYSSLQVNRSCMGENSDHYAMWEIGVPAVVYSEHSAFSNPHFDQNGGDTFDQIDQDYFYGIARFGVTFAAELAGLPANAQESELSPVNLAQALLGL